jgi:aryl-alcohol dehydrogenase-like predicted oxidoreductase
VLTRQLGPFTVSAIGLGAMPLSMNNDRAYAVFAEIGEERGVSPQQVVLAWELALGDHVIPIPGARRPASITDSAAAAELLLSAEEIARCSATTGSH